MKIGVFVGSFNPVHKGHIEIANNLLNKKLVDELLFVPGNSYWDKINIDLKHRIKMLEFYEKDNIIIEKEINNLEYTYQVMQALQKRYKNDELYLIIGADNIINFNKWKNYKELLMYNMIIIKRNNINIKYYLNKLNKKDNYKIVEDTSIKVSSTIVRDNINNKEYLEKLLDKEVLNYIIKNSLYK